MMSDNYLTMARIMKAEREKYEKTKVWGGNFTGLAELAIKSAFEAGFMAGFSGKYFEQTDIGVD
jgi:hypothetical protein